MSFILPELVVESVIRDGLANIKKNPQIVLDIFGSLLQKYAQRKYGQKELDKIMAMVQKEVSVTFSYHEVDSNVPCYSIMIGTDEDDKRSASLGDFRRDVFEDMTDPQELENLVLVDEAIVVDFDIQSGEVSFLDEVDLTDVTRNNLLVDANGIEHRIISVVDTPTKKSVYITLELVEPDSFQVNDVVQIKSSLNFKKYEVNGVNSDVRLVIGAHSKDALTTKYMYIILKHILLSRKNDLIKRGLIVSSYSGSDFSRDQAYIGDRVSTRFLTITGKAEDSWKQSEVQLIEDVQPLVLVPKSTLDVNPQTTESMGLGDKTIQIADDEEDPPVM